jgi:GntR family transcriptional regulator
VKITDDGNKPIFVQIQEGIEDMILSGSFPEETQIPSTTEISTNYRINPATALKGINLLVDGGILYKKRGIGVFVKEGAVHVLSQKRRQSFGEDYVAPMVAEARRLAITEPELIKMIQKGYEK